ncbi:ribonuclease E inhibitor RraB [Moritella viscosa]
MDFEKEFAELKVEAEEIIDNLLEDGSDPDAVYSIEHHFAGDDFAQLEKAAIAAFKLGYDVSDPEEVELEDGQTVFADIEALLKMSIEQDVTYDGWGTYFEEDAS